METLGKIFGNEAKVKLMRLFLFNPGHIYDIDAVSAQTGVKTKEAKKELLLLVKMRLVKQQMFMSEMITGTSENAKKKGAVVFKKKKVQGWILNEQFVFISDLQNLLISTLLVKEDEIVRRVSQIGKVKLIVVAGVFIRQWDSRADILVVGDRIKESQLQLIMKKMESEVGRELKYAILETQDFQYRMSVCDKLVRDIFDYPHKVISDKLGIKLSF